MFLASMVDGIFDVIVVLDSYSNLHLSYKDKFEKDTEMAHSGESEMLFKERR